MWNAPTNNVQTNEVTFCLTLFLHNPPAWVYYRVDASKNSGAMHVDKMHEGMKSMAKRAGRKGGSLRGVTVEDLRKELERRRRSSGKLLKKREKLASQIETIDAQLALLDVATGGIMRVGGVRKRPQNTMGLVPFLVKVLRGKTMGVTEVSMAVQRAGYKTTSPNFRTIVNQALIKHTDKFKKLERGKYTAA